MELNKDLYEDILKKSATRYLNYREEYGRLELEMLSKIEVVAPGETGLDGTEWIPPVEDRDGNPIHVVWGIPKNAPSPAVLVTAYKPDRSVWMDDFMERRK